MKLPSLALFVLLAVPGAITAQVRGGDTTRTRTDCRLSFFQHLPECQGDGDGASGLIVGGEDAPIDTYPWFVRLGDGCCGGSLISSQYVLSAAHCLGCIGPGTTAQIGAFRAPHGGNGDNAGQNGGQEIQSVAVAAAVGHPDYSSSDYSFDFALLKLAEKVDVVPVTLDGDGLDLIPGYTEAKDNLWPIGFGTLTSDGSIPNKLQHVNVNFVPQVACNAAYEVVITDQMMCAAGPGQDSCQGDSGGPMWDSVADAQVGVVSWGSGCADPDYPGVYSRIASVFPWIKETVCAGTDDVDPFCEGITGVPTASPTICTGVMVKVDINTDNYGTETSWKIEDRCADPPAVVLEGGGNYLSNSFVSEEACVAPGGYTFTIADTYGDGVCCGEGEGDYMVIYDGEVVANGGQFASEEATNFGFVDCDAAPPPTPTPPPVVAPTTPPPVVAPTTPPPAGGDDPASGVINIELYSLVFAFAPQAGAACPDADAPVGASLQQCALACATLANCAGFVAAPAGCSLSMGDGGDCGTPDAVFYERSAVMHFDD